MSERRRGLGGRKSKGLREPILTRVAADLAEAVREQAEAQGLTVNDYVANLLAERHGFPPVTNRGEQMQLTA